MVPAQCRQSGIVLIEAMGQIVTRGQTDLPEPPPVSVKPQENSGKHGDLLRQILSGGTDKDKLLIGALMFALLREGGDMRLILALGYILL